MKLPRSQLKNNETDEPENQLPAIGFRIFLLLLFAALLALWFLAPISKTQIEQIYSQGIYTTTTNWLVPLISQTNISISGVATLVFLFSIIISFFLIFRRSKRGLSKLSKLGLWLLNLLIWLGFLSTWFVVMWGANYKRESIETQLNLTEGAISAEDVRPLAEYLLQVIMENADAEQNVDKALVAVRDSLTEVVNGIHGNAPTLPSKVKSLPKGTLIYFGNAAGVISPWFLEAHVDGALPPAEFVAVGAHELAHIAGYAGEADADLLGALAGLTADDDFARYAVSLRLFRTIVYQLTYETSQGKELSKGALPEGWQGNLPKQALQDWEAAINAYQRYSPPESYSQMQRKVFNWYLLSQGVDEGVADYSRIVKLLVFANQQGLIFGEGNDNPEEIKIELNPIQ